MATDNTFMRLLGITRANQAQNVTDLMNAAIDYMEQGGHTTVATVKVGVLRALMNEYLTPDQLKKLGPNCLNAFKKRLKIVRKLRKNPPSENAPKKRTKKAKEEVEILDQDLTEEMVDEPEEAEKQISYVVENVEEPQEEEEEEEEILLLINEEERVEENPNPELFTEEVVEIDGPEGEVNGGPVQEVEYEVHADPSLSLEEQVVELKAMLTNLTRDFNEREAQHQVREQELLQEINLLKSQMNIREQLED